MRFSLYSRLALLVGTGAALPELLACNEHPLKPVEYEGAQEKQDSIALTVNKDVDILFVIDNSGSMGTEQATLAGNFDAFIEVLEAEGIEANYRIGVTTTDNGNPVCQGTTPEGGKLVLSSCRSRAANFQFQGTPPVDAYVEACENICPEEWSNIDIRPTFSSADGEMKERLWIESIEGVTNLPDGLSTTQAFQCLGPQGINGCGFEEHLESMYKALTRATTDDEDQFGFLRDNAILAVVFVTDEVDCSVNKDFAGAMFLPDGDRVFWSDPDAGLPTSAVCWNAGVECTGGPGTYSDCHSVNRDSAGAPTDDADAAVMRPMSRYLNFIDSFELQKQVITPNQQVLVALIGGVSGDGEVSYQDAADEAFQNDFGIGPGCTSAAGTAVPPVRLREFSEHFQVDGDNNMFSICDSDYSPALAQIATAIGDQVRPACMPACVADQAPESPDTLEPECNLQQESPQPGGDLEITNIPPCIDGELPNDSADVCFITLTDGADDAEPGFATAETTDDMSDQCIADGYNLEFQLVRREGVPATGGTAVKATCQLSTNRAHDCPHLD